jgi:putative spermidine/putrescine transport system permease protein
MMSRRNLLAAALIAPLLLLVLVSFIVPLGATLYRAVDDAEIPTILPQTTALLKQWDGKGLPSEQTYQSLIAELREAQEQQKAGPNIKLTNSDL